MVISYVYPPVIKYNYMENHHVQKKITISMAIFNSYVNVYQRVLPPLNHIKPPFSYGFPMVFHYQRVTAPYTNHICVNHY